MQIGELPEEVVIRPRVNIAFCGLDLNSVEHSTIWEAFIESRHPDRERLQFTNFTLNHVFPLAKKKRTSYEGYIERGILKTNWLEKHLREIPAVGVFFFDLDWDDHDFVEKRDSCAKRFTRFKKNLSGRESRVCLVLIQKRASSPLNDNKLAAERAHDLTRCCEISLKSLFVLQYTEHLLGFIMRLEKAIMESAKAYYSTEYRRIASQNQLLTKGSHQLVSLRHHFKMATFQELKQEIAAAVKHYKQAYSHLIELRITDPNLLEVKTVAAIINYKICQLLFAQSDPMKAIHQLLEHIGFFKASVGTAALAFEHYAWLSKQYSHFGDLFEKAVREGLTPIQIQHPGFYYSIAAQYALERKRLAQKLCKETTAAPEPDPLISTNALPYYGQRPWRIALAKGDVPDPATEELAIKSLQYHEQQLNHSDLIIPLMSGAVSQFKKYKGPRLQKRQMILLAGEYIDNRENEKALSILMHVSKDYRQERWPDILAELLGTALKAAFLSAHPSHYISLAIEYMSGWTDCSDELRSCLGRNVGRIFEGLPPVPSESDLEDCSLKWKEKLLSQRTESPVIIDMDKLKSCISCQADFSSTVYSSHEMIRLNVFVRSQLPLDINFVSKFSVHFNHPAYDTQCSISEPRVLNLVTGKTHTFEFTFLPNQQHIGEKIKITGTTMILGDNSRVPSHPSAHLKWSTLSLGRQDHRLAWEPPGSADSAHAQRRDGLKRRPSCLVADIIHREAHCDIDWRFNAPALCDEIFPIEVIFINNEMSDIGNVKAIFTAPVGVHLASGVPFLCSNERALEFDIPPMRSGACHTTVLFMMSSEARDCTINVSFRFETSLTVESGEEKIFCKCSKQDSVLIEVEPAFYLDISVLDEKFNSITRVSSVEVSKLSLELTSAVSSGYLQLGKNQLELNTGFVLCDAGDRLQPIGIELSTGETVRLCFNIQGSASTELGIRFIGEWSFAWRRRTYDHWNKSTFNLGSVQLHEPPISLSCGRPARAKLRRIVPVGYEVLNSSRHIVDTCFRVDSSDAFMFSGCKQLCLRIPPESTESIDFNLYPLLAGYVDPPNASSRINRKTRLESLDTDREIKTTIFVSPQNEGLKSPT